ncbi:unnamed protein product [Lactuca virosa]|uniref:Uncharacterized protein n=1 Tax=Lactuca virosa TaxID=75947 RepID=A0AAU9PRB3_9ASTR|nr:unnamed protein product [Lactuca virosa]
MGKLKTQFFMNKNSSILELKVVVGKLQKRLLQAKKWAPGNKNRESVPEDVKEGHVAVIASNEDEERRFIVPLAYLGRSSFKMLLESAAEEYGFRHEGALIVPCRPSEFGQWILDGAHDDVCWSS